MKQLEVDFFFFNKKKKIDARLSMRMQGRKPAYVGLTLNVFNAVPRPLWIKINFKHVSTHPKAQAFHLNPFHNKIQAFLSLEMD